jgi:hypothetical protein
MGWRRRRSELVRQIRRALKWCGRRRAREGGASRLREAERLFREALNGVNDAESDQKLLRALWVLAEFLDQIR